MKTAYTIEDMDRITDEIRKKTSLEPGIGLILGSGLGQLAESILDPTIIPYHDLPGWPVSTVEGHAGELVIGKLEGKDVLVMNGRIHYYEGYEMSQVTLPIRVMQRLGIKIIIVTNAAGGINQEFTPGNPMLITDHLNLLGMGGQRIIVWSWSSRIRLQWRNSWRVAGTSALTQMLLPKPVKREAR